MEPICCYIDPKTGKSCRKPASHETHFSRDPNDFTHSCEKHVGEMLSDAKEQHVYRIDGER